MQERGCRRRRLPPAGCRDNKDLPPRQPRACTCTPARAHASAQAQEAAAAAHRGKKALRSSSGCAEPCRVAGLRGRTALMVPSRLLKYRRVRQGAQAMACSAPSCSSSSLRPRRARPRSWSCAPPPRHPPRPPPAHELSPCRAPARRVRSRQDVVDDMRRGGEGAARAQGRCVVTPGRRL